jgi:hypothetical protein
MVITAAVEAALVSVLPEVAASHNLQALDFHQGKV